MSMDQECRMCGCNDDAPCITEEGPCCWVEHDLCSACELYDRAPVDDDGFVQSEGGLWLPR